MNTAKRTYLAAFCIALTTVSAGAEVIAGPFTNPTNSHEYYLLAPSTWTSAASQALSLGGTLATVRNQSENDWLISTFATLDSGDRALWIGLTDATEEGTFNWMSGEPVTFTNWASGEPSNSGPTNNEDYTYIIQPSGVSGLPLLTPGSWNDAPDSATGAFIIPNGVVEVVPEPSIVTLLLFAAVSIICFRISKRDTRTFTR